jgi:hypothetical protein
MLMYRNWGTPLQKPWDWNQAQHMLMYQQTLPGPGGYIFEAEECF